MKSNITALLITLPFIGAGVYIWAAIPEPEVIIQPTQEPEPFVCACATKFGNLQAHLDCHEGDRQ